MLVLSRAEAESILIGDDIRITVIRVGGDKVRLGIEAPRDLHIVREELLTEAQTDARSGKEKVA